MKTLIVDFFIKSLEIIIVDILIPLVFLILAILCFIKVSKADDFYNNPIAQQNRWQQEQYNEQQALRNQQQMIYQQQQQYQQQQFQQQQQNLYQVQPVQPIYFPVYSPY
jgi:hypothetical protein